jgi:hypothetical protein
MASFPQEINLHNQFTCTKYAHQKVTNLQNVSRRHRFYHQGMLSVAIITFWKWSVARMVKTQMVVESLTVQWTISSALWWLFRELPEDRNSDEPKHVGGWLTSDEHILCVWYKIFRILQNLKEISPNITNTKSVLRIIMYRYETRMFDKHFILLYPNLPVIIPLVMHRHGSSSTIHISGLSAFLWGILYLS